MTTQSTAPTTAAELARKAHGTLEPLHVLSYFAPEPGQGFAALGLEGSMRGYVAGRSAAMGRVGPDVVTATFYSFSPDLVARALPRAWEVADPQRYVEARYDGIDAAYRRILGEQVLASPEMAEAAELAREATTVLDSPGRPLYAAWASVPWPQPAHLQLFHAQTLLREHRGDGHIAALVLAGLDGVESMVTYVPLGKGLPEPLLRATRGWSDADWDAARTRMRERGLLEADDSLSDSGQQLRAEVERRTDAAAAAPYEHLGEQRVARLRELARPWSKAFVADMFGGAR